MIKSIFFDKKPKRLYMFFITDYLYKVMLYEPYFICNTTPLSSLGYQPSLLAPTNQRNHL